MHGDEKVIGQLNLALCRGVDGDCAVHDSVGDVPGLGL